MSHHYPGIVAQNRSGHSVCLSINSHKNDHISSEKPQHFTEDLSTPKWARRCIRRRLQTNGLAVPVMKLPYVSLSCFLSNWCRVHGSLSLSSWSLSVGGGFLGRYGSGGKSCRLAVGGLPVRSHPGRVEVSLSKTPNPRLLLKSWLVPCMASNHRWCVNVCVNEMHKLYSALDKGAI